MMRYRTLQKIALGTFVVACFVVATPSVGRAQSTEHPELVARLVREWKSLDSVPTSKSVWTWHVGIPSRLFDAGEKGRIALLFLGPSQSPSSDLELADKKVRSLMVLSYKGLKKLQDPYVLKSLVWASKALDSVTERNFVLWLRGLEKKHQGAKEARALLELIGGLQD